ncbi:MAG: ABC transporter ATP-binding protein [Candidatus Korarchaeota archaeon NZ13-K]|nr:MAG: ABC transporter ATP-binding protein [Candidatus Korarchaeota archaeon NZ13-K]
MPVSALVIFEGVSFRYEGNDSYAIRDVYLEIRRGDFVLIAGMSGSGKSTLLRMMNGLIPHFYRGEMRGRVLVDGVDTRDASVAQLARKVGLVFQNPDNQVVTLRVDREIAFGLENLGLPREEIVRRVDYALSKLRIEHLRRRSTYELSGGEKQLVSIASLIAMKPEVIALDEPTSELDPYSAARIVRALKELNRDGVTVVVAEHRLDLFAPASNRFIVVHDGRIVIESDPRDALYCKDLQVFGVRDPGVVRYAKSRGVSARRPLTVGELFRAMVR